MNYGQNIKFKLDYRINRLGGLSHKLSSLKKLIECLSADTLTCGACKDLVIYPTPIK